MKRLVLKELLEWLENKAPLVHQSLNDGAKNVPSSWPQVIQDYYLTCNGQKKDSTFLFPEQGNWLSIENALLAQKKWLDWTEEYDWGSWYKTEFLPIVAYMDQMDSAIVVDLETGKVGEIDFELQEFELLYTGMDELFADLLSNLKAEPSSQDDECLISNEEEDERQLQDALALEQKYFQINSNPLAEELFEWGKFLFRHKGDPQYGKPNLHVMRLSKKYFDQIPTNELSSKQTREMAVFNQRFKQLINS
jgi:hypothetical protein